MRRRAAVRQQRFLPEYSFVRLSVSPQIPAVKTNPLHNKKAPRDNLGLSATLLFAKSASRCGAGG
jgi:hypothetical protein